MLAILLKRKAQAKAKAAQLTQTVIQLPSIALNEGEIDSQSSTLADKPWEETQAILKQDLAYLRTLAGSQEKEPYKKALVDKYRPLVSQLLATHEDLGGLDVVWWFYQWQVDLGLLPLIHDDLRTAIAKGLETPRNWSSNGQTAYCDIVFKYSHTAHKDNTEFTPDYLIEAVEDLQAGRIATNAPLKVKMLRLVGDWHYGSGEKEKAHYLYEQVMKLDPDKGGRKTRLKELEENLGDGNSH